MLPSSLTPADQAERGRTCSGVGVLDSLGTLDPDASPRRDPGRAQAIGGCPVFLQCDA